MGKINVNGRNYVGNSVTISGNKIIVDGKNVSETDDFKGPSLTVEINGHLNMLQVDSCDKITVDGDIGNLSTVSGDVRSLNINGNVSTVSGDVKANTISGNVNTISGDIN